MNKHTVAPIAISLPPVMANLFIKKFEKNALFSYRNIETWFLVATRRWYVE